jgi:hypothetical protein
VLGVGVKCHVLGAVELGDSIEQTHDAGVDEIVQIHVNRQVFVNTNGDRLYERKVIENDLIAMFLRKLSPAERGHTGGAHGLRPLSGFCFLGIAGLPDAAKVAALVPRSSRC